MVPKASELAVPYRQPFTMTVRRPPAEQDVGRDEDVVRVHAVAVARPFAPALAPAAEVAAPVAALTPAAVPEALTSAPVPVALTATAVAVAFTPAAVPVALAPAAVPVPVAPRPLSKPSPPRPLPLPFPPPLKFPLPPPLKFPFPFPPPLKWPFPLMVPFPGKTPLPLKVPMLPVPGTMTAVLLSVLLGPPLLPMPSATATGAASLSTATVVHAAARGTLVAHVILRGRSPGPVPGGSARKHLPDRPSDVRNTPACREWSVLVIRHADGKPHNRILPQVTDRQKILGNGNSDGAPNGPPATRSPIAPSPAARAGLSVFPCAKDVVTTASRGDVECLRPSWPNLPKRRSGGGSAPVGRHSRLFC